MVYLISKQKLSSRARKYGGKVWVTIHLLNTVPKTNKEMLEVLRRFGPGEYSVKFPLPNWGGYNSVFRASVFPNRTKILYSKIEDKINTGTKKFSFVS